MLRALERIGWTEDPDAIRGGSHRKLIREGWPNYIWSFSDSEEIGPKMLARIARHTGLKPEDL
ncbi:MAG: type II toxin-antitoxin system HicA family toxin [Acidobacteriaceae bacterium]|nr:type II toxin-antitoxin system HicA family toxin [Acidobacteriaceae bacterium]